jgi:hypothetical protein
MYASPAIRVCCSMLLLAAVACHSPVQSSSPTEPADLVGQVVDARVVRGLGGFSVSSTTAARNATAAGDIQRLRVRVIGSRTTAPGTEAFVGVDGATELVSRDASARADRDLDGAFVRVWLRGVTGRATPNELTGMARVVVIDSIARRTDAP